MKTGCSVTATRFLFWSRHMPPRGVSDVSPLPGCAFTASTQRSPPPDRGPTCVMAIDRRAPEAENRR